MLFAVWDAAELRWWFWLCAPPADTPQAAPPVYPEPEDLPAAISGCLATGMREAGPLEAGRAQELLTAELGPGELCKMFFGYMATDNGRSKQMVASTIAKSYLRDSLQQFFDELMFAFSTDPGTNAASTRLTHPSPLARIRSVSA